MTRWPNDPPIPSVAYGLRHPQRQPRLGTDMRGPTGNTGKVHRLVR